MFETPKLVFQAPKSNLQFHKKNLNFKHQNWCLIHQNWCFKHQNLNTKKSSFLSTKMINTKMEITRLPNNLALMIFWAYLTCVLLYFWQSCFPRFFHTLGSSWILNQSNKNNSRLALWLGWRDFAAFDFRPFRVHS